MIAAALALALTAPQARDAEQLVGLLDYVAGDYAGAVKDGRVVAQAEYDEQKAFVADARALARSLGQPDAPFAALAALVAGVVPPADVARAARALRDELVARLRVAVVPARPASKARAAMLYGRLCASCHGATGDARTAQAEKLTPPPRSFRSRDFLDSASPRRAYHALTFGLPGTAMASFDALPPEDRLALALYVFALPHAGRPAKRAELPLREVMLASDAELRARAGERGLAWLRTEAPWRTPDPIVEARRLARAAVAAPTADEARRLAIDAYLLGFESAELRLRARDPALVAEAERAFLALRGALDTRAPPGVIAARLDALERVLDRADAALASRAPRGAYAFFASLVILLREGLEAALLVAALLAVLRRAGRADLGKLVHAGWLAALAAGALTWWLSSIVIGRIAARRELIEGAVSLLAAAVLFYVSFWLLGKADAARWMRYLRTQVEASLARRSVAVLFGLAFLAVYREAFETVLFYRALLAEAGADRAAILGGAAAGGAAVIAFAWVVFRAGARLPFGAIFGGSGLLLCLLAIAFAGAGLKELRGAGVLSPRPIAGGPEVAWMGLHPDVVGLVVQGAMLASLVIAGAVTLARRARPTTAG
ncbi:MAG: FTR1 family protein [Myxococcota bacterium]